MAKKKKTQIKSTARGFATTSIPKKVVQIEPEPEPPVTEPVVESSPPAPVPGGPTGPTLDAEQQALQDLIEKHQDRIEKDVCRTIKVSCLWCSLIGGISLMFYVSSPSNKNGAFHQVYNA